MIYNKSVFQFLDSMLNFSLLLHLHHYQLGTGLLATASPGLPYPIRYQDPPEGDATKESFQLFWWGNNWKSSLDFVVHYSIVEHSHIKNSDGPGVSRDPRLALSRAAWAAVPAPGAGLDTQLPQLRRLVVRAVPMRLSLWGKIWDTWNWSWISSKCRRNTSVGPIPWRTTMEMGCPNAAVWTPLGNGQVMSFMGRSTGILPMFRTGYKFWWWGCPEMEDTPKRQWQSNEFLVPFFQTKHGKTIIHLYMEHHRTNLISKLMQLTTSARSSKGTHVLKWETAPKQSQCKRQLARQLLEHFAGSCSALTIFITFLFILCPFCFAPLNLEHW